MSKEPHNSGSPASTSKDDQTAAPPPLSADPELEGLTIYEKKCVIINREMDLNGMGRYQWYIWLLCGFGYLLDLLWAQAFGLILSPLEQELGFNPDQSGNISASFSAGLTAGAFMWGVLVDIVGRQWSFNLTCLISAAFGLGLGGTQSYNSFLVLTAFVGLGIGGNIPIDSTICLEFLPQNRRFLLALLSLFQPIGVVLTTAFAFAFIPTHSCQPNWTDANPLPSCNKVPAGTPCCGKENNMGWRYLMFTIGAITMGVFILRFVVFRFKESPKFHCFRGHDDRAVEVLQYVAKFNGRECSVSLDTFDALTNEDSSISSDRNLLGAGSKQRSQSIGKQLKLELLRYSLLFKDWYSTRLILLVWLIYITDFWGFSLAGTYLPQILSIKNAELHLTITQTYRSYVYIYLPGIVGVLLGGMMYAVPTVGRKYAMVLSSGLMAASIFIFSAVNTEASNIGLNAMEYIFQSAFNAVLYGWTPEAFPAPVRGTACGISSFWGRLFSIIAPLTAQSLIPNSGLKGAAISRVLFLAGGVTFGATLGTLLLPGNSKLSRQSM